MRKGFAENARDTLHIKETITRSRHIAIRGLEYRISVVYFFLQVVGDASHVTIS